MTNELITYPGFMDRATIPLFNPCGDVTVINGTEDEYSTWFGISILNTTITVRQIIGAD